MLAAQYWWAPNGVSHCMYRSCHVIVILYAMARPVEGALVMCNVSILSK